MSVQYILIKLLGIMQLVLNLIVYSSYKTMFSSITSLPIDVL